MFATFTFNCCSFPKNQTRDWLIAIGRDVNTSVNQQRICSEHFLPDEFEYVGLLKKIKASAIPSLNLPVAQEAINPEEASRTDIIVSSHPIDPSLASTSQSQYQIELGPSTSFPLEKTSSDSSLLDSGSSDVDKDSRYVVSLTIYFKMVFENIGLFN